MKTNELKKELESKGWNFCKNSNGFMATNERLGKRVDSHRLYGVVEKALYWENRLKSDK